MTTLVEMAAATDRGRVRARNEDCVAIRPEADLAIVADGMGGHKAGQVASRMAVDAVAEGIEAAGRELAGSLNAERAEKLIAEHIGRANARIFAAGVARPDYAGMGTTIVVGLWYDTRMSVGHVGDSRLYRLRAGALEQLTRDHTLVQEHIDRGTLTHESARKVAIRSILTRAVGSDASVNAELNTFEVMRDDIYLLCSDGLTEMLSDAEIGMLLTANPIQQAADDLVAKANERGGVDNISVIVARVLHADIVDDAKTRSAQSGTGS